MRRWIFRMMVGLVPLAAACGDPATTGQSDPGQSGKQNEVALGAMSADEIEARMSEANGGFEVGDRVVGTDDTSVAPEDAASLAESLGLTAEELEQTAALHSAGSDGHEGVGNPEPSPICGGGVVSGAWKPVPSSPKAGIFHGQIFAWPNGRIDSVYQLVGLFFSNGRLAGGIVDAQNGVIELVSGTYGHGQFSLFIGGEGREAVGLIEGRYLLEEKTFAGRWVRYCQPQPPPPPPPACETHFEKLDRCTEEDALRQLAARRCAADRLTLARFAVFGPCHALKDRDSADGRYDWAPAPRYSEMKYTCCAGKPIPPMPPVDCEEHDIDLGGECVDLEILARRAKATCAKEDRRLGDFNPRRCKTIDDRPSGSDISRWPNPKVGYEGASFSCCTATKVCPDDPCAYLCKGLPLPEGCDMQPKCACPAPPQHPTCEAGKMVFKSCLGRLEILQMVAKACGGAEPYSFKFGPACNPDGPATKIHTYTGVAYECCAPDQLVCPEDPCQYLCDHGELPKGCDQAPACPRHCPIFDRPEPECPSKTEFCRLICSGAEVKLHAECTAYQCDCAFN